MDINWKFDNDKPIYVQIVKQVKRCIASGELKAGDRIESVREIAAKAKVNPNTVQRALSELERTGLVYTERTNGRFITEDVSLVEAIKEDIAKKEVSVFLNNMYYIGFNNADVINLIKNYKEDEDCE